MDAKLVKKIDGLYRNMKPMPALSFAGVIIPIILLLAAPLGLVYAAQRSKLLNTLDASQPTGDSKVDEQLMFIRSHGLRLYVPLIVLGCYVLVVGGLVGVAVMSS